MTKQLRFPTGPRPTPVTHLDEYTRRIGRAGVADARAILFRSRTPFELPRDASLDVSLAQDVASLKLSWVFLDKMLRPCADEDIDRVGVTIAVVGAGTADPFNVSYRCDQTPVEVDRYFGLRNPNYTILVQAFSRENFPVYSVREVALLERGSNEFTAVLQPDGGQLILQWQFEVPGSAPTSDCSDAMVGVSNSSVE